MARSRLNLLSSQAQEAPHGPPRPAAMIGTVHRRRLRELWRSAGWPSHDLVEVELLVAGLVERVRDDSGRETLRLTEAGLAELASTLQRNRAARDTHEALVERVALEMHRAGRVVWRGLSLRAPVADSVTSPAGEVLPVTRWAMAMPDVFSIRHTTLEDQVAPVVHEIKVRRSDLLAELKRPTKGLAYQALAAECWLVLADGIGEPDEIPPPYGVMRAYPVAGTSASEPVFGALEVLRPAQRRPFKMPFSTWMVLARATAERFEDSSGQARLGGMGQNQPLTDPDPLAAR
jgi:hypothetical protein